MHRIHNNNNNNEDDDDDDDDEDDADNNNNNNTTLHRIWSLDVQLILKSICNLLTAGMSTLSNQLLVKTDVTERTQCAILKRLFRKVYKQ